MQPSPDLELERTERVADRRRREYRSRRPVKCGEESVACRIELASLKAGELAPYDGVVLLQQLPPGRIAERGGPFGRADDVREEDGRQNALRHDPARELREELSRRCDCRLMSVVVGPRVDPLERRQL